MFRSIRSLRDVVDWGLCTGCGACACCDYGNVSLLNFENAGIRPVFKSECESCRDCLTFCPGAGSDGAFASGRRSSSRADEEFGPALEIWEGYASDPEIRYRASSGGILSALALYCLAKESMSFVLHTAADPQKPWLNVTVKSKTREDLLSRSGSRYSPASPCDLLGDIETSDGLCAFIGKPCDTAAAMMLAAHRPELRQRLGLVMACFCAGTPSTRGTLDLLQEHGTSTKDLKQLRYRGNGWPGCFQPVSRNASEGSSTPYEQAWGKLTSYVPFRCRICPDGLGRIADIACGDAWEKLDRANPGQSLVIVRTERGRGILHRAKEAGYLVLEPASADAVFAAQPSLLNKRRKIFGRLAARWMLGIPNPQFRNFSLLHSWLRLSLINKARTLAGTFVRTIERGLWARKRLA